MYLVQTNNNADHIPREDKWKWVDDLTAVEIVNMITVGLSSYNLFLQTSQYMDSLSAKII